MKRILVVLAIVAAAAFVGASAGGATAAPSSVFCINGHTYTDPLGADFLTVAAGEGGYYAENDPEEFTSHEFLFEVYDGDEFLASDPDFDPTGLIFVPVSIGACNVAPPPQIDNVFLCYSTFSNVPAVFPAPVAAALLKGGGYWTPYAVPGSADGGTNIGGYHLVCNLASGQAAGDNTLGGAGEVDGANTKPDVSNTAGYYPIIGG